MCVPWFGIMRRKRTGLTVEPSTFGIIYTFFASGTCTIVMVLLTFVMEHVQLELGVAN